MKFVQRVIVSMMLMSITLYAGLSNALQFGSAFGEVKEVAAGGVGTGAPAKNLVYFTIDGNMQFASCASSSSPHFVINNDEGGKTMVSLLLSAKMSGKKVHVAGKGTCNTIPGHEDVSLIYVD